MLTFDEPTHAYAWQGKPVPGVTAVIRGALGDPFARIDPDVLERKRAIGKAAHRAVELDDAGKLDEATVHPAVVPYLEAWRAFRRESGFAPLLSEQKGYHETYGYAGQLDVLGRINGDRAVVDLKTGLPGLQAAIQTAAYAMLVPYELTPGLQPRRFALLAQINGRYKFIEYTAPGDWRDFLACLAVYRLKQRIEP